MLFSRSEYVCCMFGSLKSVESIIATENFHSQANMPQFNYCSTIMELELLMCRFIRSLREEDILLYIQVCYELCPWFYTLDHSGYQ